MKSLRLMLAAGSALSLLAAPATLAAQDETVPMIEAEPATDDGGQLSDDEQAMAALAGMMGGMMKAEPLTAEQQARLPAAEKLIDRIMPKGAMAELTSGMFDGLGGLGGLGDMPSGPKPALARALSLSPFDVEPLSDEQAAEALALLDPAWQEREAATKAMIPELLGEVMDVMEPPMRRAMAELYAIRFSETELAAIDTFFTTEAGSKYARESLSMASDPRLMAASMEAMPALFSMIGQMESRITERTANLPAARSFSDLSKADKAKVAKLTGMSVEEIESSIVSTSPVMVPEPPQID